MSGDTLRIALLTHSVNPRGGVVHALELARALHEAGRDVTVFAPAAPGDAMFRDVPCRVVLARVDGRPRGVAEMVRARIAAIKYALLEHDASGFDVLHAQDSITGNALAELRQSGEIDGFVRTVHHLDVFDDPQLERWQERAWREADQVLCVSAAWAATMRKRLGVDASVVPNGVDVGRFARAREADMQAVRRRFGLHGAPVVLAIGGIEQRKNSIALLDAFARLRGTIPDARLVIGGGASLLDHDAYARRFVARAAALGLGIGVDEAVVPTGPLDDAALVALMHCATWCRWCRSARDSVWSCLRRSRAASRSSYPKSNRLPSIWTSTRACGPIPPTWIRSPMRCATRFRGGVVPISRMPFPHC